MIANFKTESGVTRPVARVYGTYGKLNDAKPTQRGKLHGGSAVPSIDAQTTKSRWHARASSRLNQPIAGVYREAAAVCLNRHHSPPVEVTIADNGLNSLAELTWVEPDARIVAAWANDIDATEAGAYGCVIAGAELSRGLFTVRRAETGTGADYYIGPQGSGDDLENCLRLEVSGLSSGTSKDVSRRLVEKVRQALDGNSNLPALAGVVGFSQMDIERQ